MKTEDREKIGELYEEGIWDRTKAGVAGVRGGLGGLKLLGGQGYAKGAQAAKSGSLLTSFIQKMKNEVGVFETDALKYPTDRALPSIRQKLVDIKAVLNSF